MQEKMERIFKYLCLSVIDRCNLQCRHCRFSKESVASFDPQRQLSDDDFVQVAFVAGRLGMNKIRISGGEPLVRPNVAALIHRLVRLPGNPEVNLVTNGLLLEEMAEELKQAGLTRVSVRLDTLRADRFAALTGSEGLPHVLAGLEAASRAGLAPRVIVSPVRGVNEDEIVDFARLTLTHPWEVRFTEGPLAGEETDACCRERLSIAAVREELSRLGILLPVPQLGAKGPVRLFRYPASRGTVGVIHGVSHHICSECNRLYITAAGRIRCCLISSPGLDLKPALRSASSEKELEERFLAVTTLKPEPHQPDTGVCRWDSWSLPGVGG